MKLEEIAGKLNLRVLCCDEGLSREVRGGFVGDLLSDVMANSREGDLWITRQVHPNIVAVAVMKEHSAILLVQGGIPVEDTLSRARKEGIPILGTEINGFEAAGKIYGLMNP
ncbi:MAG TPA: DRTGG domain-containing protein [Syntrophales bacterium]|nr:DRTGG domain-containing protein [Syntrophales bacterium]